MDLARSRGPGYLTHGFADAKPLVLISVETDSRANDRVLLNLSNIVRRAVSLDAADYALGVYLLKTTSDAFSAAPSAGDGLVSVPTVFGARILPELPRSAQWFVVRSSEHPLHAISFAARALEETYPDLKGVLTLLSAPGLRIDRETAASLIHLFSSMFPTTPSAVLGEDDFFQQAVARLFKASSRIHSNNAGARGIAEFLAELAVSQETTRRVLDPCARDCSNLIAAARALTRRDRVGGQLAFSGYERTPREWALGRMNMWLMGLAAHDVQLGLPDLIAERAFDAIVMVPPITTRSERQDLQMIELCAQSLGSNGIASMLLPSGILFRDGRDRAMRERLILAGLVDAVVALPNGMFEGTRVSACALVLRKSKDSARPVLFLDGERILDQTHSRGGLDEAEVAHLSTLVRQRTASPNVGRLVGIDEIMDFDGVLEVRRYLGTRYEQPEQYFLSFSTEAKQTLRDEQVAALEMLEFFLSEERTESGPVRFVGPHRFGKTVVIHELARRLRQSGSNKAPRLVSGGSGDARELVQALESPWKDGTCVIVDDWSYVRFEGDQLARFQLAFDQFLGSPKNRVILVCDSPDTLDGNDLAALPPKWIAKTATISMNARYDLQLGGAAREPIEALLGDVAADTKSLRAWLSTMVPDSLRTRIDQLGIEPDAWLRQFARELLTTEDIIALANSGIANEALQTLLWEAFLRDCVRSAPWLLEEMSAAGLDLTSNDAHLGIFLHRTRQRANDFIAGLLRPSDAQRLFRSTEPSGTKQERIAQAFEAWRDASS